MEEFPLKVRTLCVPVCVCRTLMVVASLIYLCGVLVLLCQKGSAVPQGSFTMTAHGVNPLPHDLNSHAVNHKSIKNKSRESKNLKAMQVFQDDLMEMD